MIDSVRRIDQKRQPPQQRKKKPAMPTNAMASNRETIRKIIASKKPIWRFNLFHLKSLRNFHFHESLSLWKLNVLLFFVFFMSIASSISALSLSLSKPPVLVRRLPQQSAGGTDFQFNLFRCCLRVDVFDIMVNAIKGLFISCDVPMAQFIINYNASLPTSHRFIIHILDNTHMFVQPHVADMIRNAISEFRDQISYEKPTWTMLVI